MIHRASLAFFNLFSLFFVFHKSGLCNLSSNLHFDAFSGSLSQPCLSFFHVSYSSTFSFPPSPLPPYCPPQMPPCPRSFPRLLHALKLSLCPLWFFGNNNATWDVGTEVGCISGGLSDRAFELSCTINPVGGGCNRPQVCCAAHTEVNTQPAGTELMQSWRRKVLLRQQTPQGTSSACTRYWGQNSQFPPHSCSIMPQRGSPGSLHPIAPVQPHQHKQQRWNTRRNMPSQKVSKIRRLLIKSCLQIKPELKAK